MNQHYRLHKGQKPFKCEYCSKEFASKSNLKTHRNKHSLFGSALIKILLDSASKEREFQFFCTECDGKFRLKDEYKDHIKKYH